MSSRRRLMVKTLVLGATAGLLTVILFGWLPTVFFGHVHIVASAMPRVIDSASVAKGDYLARAGDCAACHTQAPDGKPYAGGLPIATPIGTIYSTNITPDRKTGIGDYSFADFDRAVRHGVNPAGRSLYPAMPYDAFSIITDADLHDLYAYFMRGVTPVTQANRASTVPWPLNLRWPLTWWRWLFAPKVESYRPSAGAEAVVSRGAYLVEGLGHCGACHTPRYFTMQEKALAASDGSNYLSGGGAPIDGWVAPDLRGDRRDGLGTWSVPELVQFLKTGHSVRSVVFGGMADVVADSMQYMSDSDLFAIASFLKSLPPKDSQNVLPDNDGALIYAASCAACHRPHGEGIPVVFPALAGNTLMDTKDPTSLIHIILSGATPPVTHNIVAASSMPPFAAHLSDQQIAVVVSFIRSKWGNHGRAVSAHDVAIVRKAVNAPAYLGK